MSRLEFSFQDTITEIDALSKFASRFLSPDSRPILLQLRTILENLRSTATERRVDWEIRSDLPIRTIVSRGCYQPDDEGELNVFAEISSLWQVQRVKPLGKKHTRAERFALSGKASTRVRVFKEKRGGGKGPQLAMWRMEIGAFDAPGCHFHVQILGEETDGPFPKALDVPRLPGFICTPPAVVEYVIGELFQEQWAQHLSSQTADLNRWSPIQRQRLSAVLDWHSEKVKESSGSPWVGLKQAKPASSLFVSA